MWWSDNLSNSWNSWKQQNYLWWSIWSWWQRESSKNRRGLFDKKRWVPSWDFNSDWSVFRDKWAILLWNTADCTEEIWETLPFLLSSLNKHHPEWWSKWQWQWLQICPTSGNYFSSSASEKWLSIFIAVSMLWLHLNNDKYEGFIKRTFIVRKYSS